MQIINRNIKALALFCKNAQDEAKDEIKKNIILI